MPKLLSSILQTEPQTGTSGSVIIGGDLQHPPKHMLTHISSLSSAMQHGGGRVPSVNPTCDYLIAAKHEAGGKIFVQFADHYGRSVDLSEFSIPVATLKMETVRASSWGSSAEVTDNTGHVVHIDSAVLRAHIDPEYATELERAISGLG